MADKKAPPAPRKKLTYLERFLPTQRAIASKRVCPTCGSGPGGKCTFVVRADRRGDLMPGFHVERYPEYPSEVAA